MIIEPVRIAPARPIGAPQLIDPVNVRLAARLHYADGQTLVPVRSPLYCERVFADTVLTVLDTIAAEHQIGLVYLGLYNPRAARRKDGSPIKPERWSNHAYGLALDFKGIMGSNGAGQYLPVSAMRSLVWNEMLVDIETRCRNAIAAAGRKAEIVDEGAWIHFGIWP
jgi:hypothetical protein